MAGDLLLRFLIGGLVISAFALVGHVVRPKTFAGLFGAAPSVALATLALAFRDQGVAYVATEGRSMIVGAVALAAYSTAVSYALLRRGWSATASAVLSWSIWLVVAFGVWGALLRG